MTESMSLPATISAFVCVCLKVSQLGLLASVDDVGWCNVQVWKAAQAWHLICIAMQGWKSVGQALHLHHFRCCLTS